MRARETHGLRASIRPVCPKRRVEHVNIKSAIPRGRTIAPHLHLPGRKLQNISTGHRISAYQVPGAHPGGYPGTKMGVPQPCRESLSLFRSSGSKQYHCPYSPVTTGMLQRRSLPAVRRSGTNAIFQ